MPVYSLARAATEAGRSRSTLLAAIRTGRLSATRNSTTGAWAIDASELARAFPPGGDRHDDRHAGTSGTDRGDSGAPPSLIAAKDALIAEQRTMLDDLRRRLDESERERREQAARIAALLTDQRAKPDQEVNLPLEAPRRRWWSWRRRG